MPKELILTETNEKYWLLNLGKYNADDDIVISSEIAKEILRLKALSMCKMLNKDEVNDFLIDIMPSYYNEEKGDNIYEFSIRKIPQFAKKITSRFGTRAVKFPEERTISYEGCTIELLEDMSNKEKVIYDIGFNHSTDKFKELNKRGE